MTTTRAKQIATKSLSIPTLPVIVQRVAQVLQDPQAGSREIGALVAQDPGIAAKVLKIANSAYYGLRERCLSTEQASTVLGMRVLRNVVTQAAVISQFDHLAGSEFDLDGMWRHSVLTAQAAHMLAKRARGSLGIGADELYTCGLLHDIGQVVLLENTGAEYVEIVRRSQRENLPLFVCEEQHLGFTHTDVGAMIAVQWGLPTQIASAIEFHHGPREAVERDPVVALIAHTNLAVQRAAAGNLAASAATFDAPTLRVLGLSGEAVGEMVEHISRTMHTVEV